MESICYSYCESCAHLRGFLIRFDILGRTSGHPWRHRSRTGGGGHIEAYSRGRSWYERSVLLQQHATKAIAQLIKDAKQAHWGVGDVRKDEAIAVEPVRVLRVESHELVEKNVRNRCHAHRGTGVTRVRFRGGIDLQLTLSAPH